MTVESVGDGYSCVTFDSMNSTVSITLSIESAAMEALLSEQIQPFFTEYESNCSRFISGNPLGQLNTDPAHTHEVPEHLYLAVQAAYEAYTSTSGVFDPRILPNLQQLGYGASFEASAEARGSEPAQPPERAEWKPALSIKGGAFFVNPGGSPLDLGGIAKGLAVDLMTVILKPLANSGFINAGGDLQTWGHNPEGDGWRIGVENPVNTLDDEPIAVLELHDSGLATSSTRKRAWKTTDGQHVHHLIDTATGTSAHSSIRSVTVIHPHTHIAETLTKQLFFAGSEHIAETASQAGALALWVDADGTLFHTDNLGAALLWTKSS